MVLGILYCIDTYLPRNYTWQYMALLVFPIYIKSVILCDKKDIKPGEIGKETL